MADEPKKKMGRPSKADGPTTPRTIRPTDEQWALWQDKARDAGWGDDVRGWVLEACDAYATKGG